MSEYQLSSRKFGSIGRFQPDPSPPQRDGLTGVSTYDTFSATISWPSENSLSLIVQRHSHLISLSSNVCLTLSLFDRRRYDRYNITISFCLEPGNNAFHYA